MRCHDITSSPLTNKFISLICIQNPKHPTYPIIKLDIEGGKIFRLYNSDIDFIKAVKEL